MRVLPLSLISLLWLSSPTLAIHETDVGVVDWHKKHIGVPSSSPVFHRVGGKTTRSVVLAKTESNVLGALDPIDGEIVWRHIFEPEDPIVTFERNGNVLTSLSGPGGSTLRAFDVLNGDLLMEKRLHDPSVGIPEAATSIAFGAEDLTVLTNGYTVNQVSTGGEIRWKWTSVDQGSLVLYSKVITTAEGVYVIGLSKSFASYTVHVTVLSHASGKLLADSDVSSSISSEHDILTLGSRLVWLDTNGSIRYISLTPTLSSKPSKIQGSYQKIVDVSLPAHFVGVQSDGTGQVISLDDSQSPWEFSRSSPSIYAGGFDKSNRPYISRLYQSTSAAYVELYAPHLEMTTGYSFPFPSDTTRITGISMDAANPSEHTVIGRLLLRTNFGGLEMWQQDKVQWVREEGLASLAGNVKFVEMPEQRIAAAGERHDEGFVGRVIRQIEEAKGFPAYLSGFVKRFATGSALSPAVRDAFGFRQIVLATSRFGKVYAIDSGNGAILWSKVLLGQGRVVPVKLFVTRTVGDGDGVNPQAVVVAEIRGEKFVDTVVYHFDVLTGQSIEESEDGNLRGSRLFGGSLKEVLMYEGETGKTILALDESLQLHPYPNNPSIRSEFASISPSLSFPLLSASRDQLAGYQVTEKGKAYPTWTLVVPSTPGTLTPALRTPIASLGKVLGNRTTLYKYLNPRLVLLTSPSSISIVDTAKGTVIYDARVPGDGGVKATLTENWLVYYYWDEEETKAGRMVVVEFYEGKGVDDKTGSSDLSAYGKENVDITAYEQAYVYPAGGIRAITSTVTKFGISGKDVIVATTNNKIHSVSRKLLNSRRPKGKPTSEQAEEGLFQYGPVIGEDPKRVLSHHYPVAGVEGLVTAPALLESTSLVFAYGLDMFTTRVAPSGTFDILNENFNKAQLVLTISGLGIAIMFTRPMVRRKKLRERWYQ